jgi:Nucleotidyl transferase AbiEii toxin, Type IV TA system
MTNRRNIGASVRARLLERAREQKADFQILLTRYTLERLLYRLSLSAYRDRFILKGAMLFSMWVETPFRPTRDLDLLGRGPADVQSIAEAFRAVCSVSVPDDGVEFDIARLEAAPIREDLKYGGVRKKCNRVLRPIAGFLRRPARARRSAMVPGVDCIEMELQPSARSGTTSRDDGHHRSRGADCARESFLGIHANPRRPRQSGPSGRAGYDRQHVAGISTHPDNSWMVQIARNVTDIRDGFVRGKRYLILDRDTKYSDAFRGIITRTGTEVVLLPPRS